ncbi:MAG: hypothetical protein CSA20_08430 [Deltaproteobacteria bacterium]|nr:MAG: hypothetical protein CSB23_04435 [Deltaproteobacteria bacterium]PIE72353.1 MAG: hypothetical protein CSA20_08430 [Deltaproteobacteria bacterium]
MSAAGELAQKAEATRQMGIIVWKKQFSCPMKCGPASGRNIYYARFWPIRQVVLDKMADAIVLVYYTFVI